MDIQTSLKKIIKYFVVFGIIYLATIYIPSNKMTVYESLMISMIAAILYAILDYIMPTYIIKEKTLNINA